MTISNDNSQAVHDYITNELVNDPELKIEKEEDLLLAGLLDSVSVVRLVSFMEELYGIKIPAEDILLEHFGSLKQMDDYVKTRL